MTDKIISTTFVVSFLKRLMSRLKINLELLDNDNPIKMYHEGLQLGGLTVSSKGLTTSLGYEYGLSTADVIIDSKRVLGKGSSGSVRSAIHRTTGKMIALKEIKVTSNAHMQEIRRELETLEHNGTTSPYLVDFYGAYSHEGSVFIAMECMDGSLDNVRTSLSPEVLPSVTRSILKGLCYLHRNLHLIHRDLKPSNILYSTDGRVKISDFGVSSRVDCTRADAHSFVGTVTYMSPERLKGDPHSFSADIWSFGVVVTELALGRCPFMERLTLNNKSTEGCFWTLLQHLTSEGPVFALPSSLDPPLADFILKCIKKNPKERLTCEELLREPFVAGGNEEEDKRIIQKWLATLSTEAEAEANSTQRPTENLPLPILLQSSSTETSLNLDDELGKLLQ